MSYITDTITALAANGHKITRPRRLVVETLGAATQPLSPYDIQDRLRAQDRHLDHVTVYRVLALLDRLGLVHRIFTSGGYVRCQLGPQEGCHHYLICRRCGSLREFADEALCAETGNVAARLGFYVEHHIAEASGLCASCCSATQLTNPTP